MKYILIYAFFLISVFHTSCGQNQTNVPKNIIHSHPEDIVTSDPIFIYTPLRYVRKIKQERNGNILIVGSYSSEYGSDVFRYDGKSFTNLTSELDSHKFLDILEDRRGNIWFASLDSGVYYYNGKSFHHFTTREGLANNAVWCIYEDKAGIIWFGTEGGEVSRYDGKSFRNFTTKVGPSNKITKIIEDKTGKLWIGTKDEAFVYDGKTFTALIHEGKAFNNVGSMTEDKNGNIWLCVNGKPANGLWRYDGSTFTNVSQKNVHTVTEDKKGNIWTIGTVKTNGVLASALSRYDQQSLYNKKPPITQILPREPALLALFAANDGSILVGTTDGLMYRYDGKALAHFKSNEGQNL